MSSPVIVEDGTIVAGANVYSTMAESNAYHDARGNSAWTGASEKAREEAKIKATDYSIQVYRNCWKGIRVSEDQTLDWPRAGVQTEDFFEPDTGPRPALFPGLAFILGDDVVPEDIKRMEHELALRAISGDLLPDRDGTQNIKRLQAGPAAIEYFPNGKGPDEKIFEVIDLIIEPYIWPQKGQARLFRA
jgi:hypothetical protein